MTAPHQTGSVEAQLGQRTLGGRYELIEPLGHGGMSTVYRGRDRSLGRDVAVKIIRHDPAAHADVAHLRERFRREAANAARIPPHPNVVQIYDYGTDPELDLDFIVMELLPGRDLKAELQQRQPGRSEAVRILLQAARGLAAGHRVGIMHRDVKPANILLVGDAEVESVRILDFGIAKALEDDAEDDLTQISGIPHTPAYASPEQREAGGTLTPASDVYQLGLVAYEMLAGARPYDPHERERIRAGEEIPLPVRGRWSEVPGSIREVVERALRRDPRARYPDAAAFAEALANAEEEDQTLVAPPAAAGATITAPASPIPDSAPAGIRVGPGWRSLSREVRFALVAVIAVLLLWGLIRVLGGAEDDFSAEIRSTAELEEQFAPLYHEAAERLGEEGGSDAP